MLLTNLLQDLDIPLSECYLVLLVLKGLKLPHLELEFSVDEKSISSFNWTPFIAGFVSTIVLTLVFAVLGFQIF